MNASTAADHRPFQSRDHLATDDVGIVTAIDLAGRSTFIHSDHPTHAGHPDGTVDDGDMLRTDAERGCRNGPTHSRQPLIFKVQFDQGITIGDEIHQLILNDHVHQSTGITVFERSQRNDVTTIDDVEHQQLVVECLIPETAGDETAVVGSAMMIITQDRVLRGIGRRFLWEFKHRLHRIAPRGGKHRTTQNGEKPRL